MKEDNDDLQFDEDLLTRKRSVSDDIAVISPEQNQRLLMKHAQIVVASRTERVKMIEDTHVKTFHDSSHGEEFREFR